MFIAALLTIYKIWKKPKCPSIEDEIKNVWYIHTVEYFLAIKNEILPFVTTWMDVDGMLSEISQRQILLIGI